MLHKSLIRSIIEYCGFLTSPCEENSFNTLQKIQNAALRYAIGYHCTTPINITVLESKIPYLQFRFEYLGYRFILKGFALANNKIIDQLKESCSFTTSFI